MVDGRNKLVVRIDKARRSVDEDAGDGAAVAASVGMRELGAGDERTPQLGDAFESQERPDGQPQEDLYQKVFVGADDLCRRESIGGFRRVRHHFFLFFLGQTG